DKGERWSPLGKLDAAARGEVAIHPTRADTLLVGTDDGVRVSADGGATWSRGDGPSGEALSFHFAPKAIFAATRKGIWRSDDRRATWVAKVAGLPSASLRSFAGGWSAKSKTTLLYCTVPCTSSG